MKRARRETEAKLPGLGELLYAWAVFKVLDTLSRPRPQAPAPPPPDAGH